MPTVPRRRRSTSRLLAVLLGALLLVVAAGCSDDSDDSSDDTTTTTAADSGGGDESTTTAAGGGESEETKRFDESIQQELKDVGCYSGEIDGILGPESDAAIVSFQRDYGIEADGELGPETETALKDAVAAGETVCGASGGSTTTHSESTTTTTGGGGGGAPCTATAISAALSSGSEISSYVCSGGYAAGTLSSGDKFIVQDDGSSWAAMADDPCGGASAGLPPIILEDGCAA